MNKEIIGIALTSLTLMIVPALNHAQEMQIDAISFTTNDSNSVRYDDRNANGGDQINHLSNHYDTPDYHYNSSYDDRKMGRSRASSGYSRFGRNFDEPDFFSSGISSYQGTSTGPGPNGGYPGTPHGVYPTRYVDPSIYPNSYMRVQ